MLQRACPVCNGTKQTVIQNIKMNVPEDYHLPVQYDVVACADCGMVYADTAASMEDYDWYYTHCNFYGDDSKDDNSERYDWMEELLEKYLTKDSVMLELGAGNGRYAIALKRNGYARITATDPSGEIVERLQKAGVNAYVTNIYADPASDEQGKYDAVFLFEVARASASSAKRNCEYRSVTADGWIFYAKCSRLFADCGRYLQYSELL